MVAHLLVAGGKLSHDRAARELQVGTAVELIAGNEKDLLLEADVGLESGGFETKMLQKARPLFTHGVIGTKERRLLVEGHAVVGNEDGGNVDHLIAEENWGARVDDEVSTSGVSRTETTIGVRRAVRFTLDEVASVEVIANLIRLAVELKHLIVDLPRLSMANTRGRQRLEPVAKCVSSIAHGPKKGSGKVEGRRQEPQWRQVRTSYNRKGESVTTI